jgi:hypothetical protein
MFRRGFWATPLISIDSDLNVALVFTAISVGSTIRRVESWLDRGGFSDHLSDARRGLNYESWVRHEASEAISKNAILSNASSIKDSINRTKDGGEQIDLLIMIGRMLIVAEIKCLLAPAESIERYDYLTKLKSAAQQVNLKIKWVAGNRKSVADKLKMSLEEVELLRIVPIIIVNQGAGFGLTVEGVLVVDFHFLYLYLADNKYVSSAAFDMRVGTSMMHEVPLYSNENEAESRFEETMSRPPTLVRFIEAADWRDNHFPMSNGQDLLAASCHFSKSTYDRPVTTAALAMSKRSVLRTRHS